MAQGEQQQSKDTAVFLAAGFEEETVVTLLCRLRHAGLPVSLISPSTQPLTGTHGVTLCPDKLLLDLPKEKSFHLVIVPGNGRCVQSLLVCPRFHHLLKNSLAEGGYVAALDAAVPALDAAGIPRYAADPAHYLRQDHTPLNEFITYLSRLAQAPSLPDPFTTPSGA